MAEGALSGLTVIALEQAVAAPLASSRLADAGARVIKLERPTGDFARHYDGHAKGNSSYFVWLNRNKQSCRVDLRQENDRELVQRMIASADIFIQNLGPGATDRLGIGSAELRRAHPRLITCDIVGFAPDTPHASRKAYDLMIQAESGLAAITGTPDSEPSRIGISICDIATGMTAHAQILEALIARGTTGKGRGISVALFDVAAEMMNIPYIAARHGGSAPRRMGLAHPSIAPYGAYSTRDGLLLVAVQNDREWASFCRHVLLDETMIDDTRFSGIDARVNNRTVMDDKIGSLFSKMCMADLLDRLEVGRIAYARVSELGDLLRHDALSMTTAQVDGQMIDMIAPPAIVDGMRSGGGAIPVLGAHDGELRAEFAADAENNEVRIARS